jgi:hypothetical protein
MQLFFPATLQGTTQEDGELQRTLHHRHQHQQWLQRLTPKLGLETPADCMPHSIRSAECPGHIADHIPAHSAGWRSRPPALHPRRSLGCWRGLSPDPAQGSGPFAKVKAVLAPPRADDCFQSATSPGTSSNFLVSPMVERPAEPAICRLLHACRPALKGHPVPSSPRRWPCASLWRNPPRLAPGSLHSRNKQHVILGIEHYYKLQSMESH